MILAFSPTRNTPGKKDATGAFIPEARNFLKFHKVPDENLVMIDNTQSAAGMRRQVYAALDRPHQAQIDGLAFFCHGFKAGIQFGIRMSNVKEFVAKLKPIVDPDVRITFYACDAGRDDDRERDDDLAEFGGDNGFADRVRDELCASGKTGCIIDAHTTAAHTTMNPDVRRFEGMGSPLGGVGGYYIVPRGSRGWQAWRKALRTDFRFQFPYLTTAEIHRRLLK